VGVEDVQEPVLSRYKWEMLMLDVYVPSAVTTSMTKGFPASIAEKQVELRNNTK
jgi:hypothetical protein